MLWLMVVLLRVRLVVLWLRVLLMVQAVKAARGRLCGNELRPQVSVPQVLVTHTLPARLLKSRTTATTTSTAMYDVPMPQVTPVL